MLHATTSALKYRLALGSCAVVALCTLYVTRPTARSNASPSIWRHNSGRIPRLEIDRRGHPSDRKEKVDQLRPQLGNEIAINAFKEGKIPFPDERPRLFPQPRPSHHH
jgi:hypothetical protein